MTPEYEVTYLGSRPCADGIGTFRFSRPSEYSFTPGQFFSLSLETEDGLVSKFFSHADAPGDPAIELTTRLSGSAFKNKLLALSVGDVVRISGPKGRLGVPEGSTAVGFLAGGVGITPAHSIIRNVMQTGSPLKVALFYGNRDEACVPYGEEFRGYAASNPRFLYVDTLDHPGPDWAGESGFISAEMIRRHLSDPGALHWIVAGPPPMVEAMKRVVSDLELSPERVSYELFAGYDTNG
jgi:ferredoxin-NADP reductase